MCGISACHCDVWCEQSLTDKSWTRSSRYYMTWLLQWCLIPKSFRFSGPMYVSTMFHFHGHCQRQGPFFWTWHRPLSVPFKFTVPSSLLQSSCSCDCRMCRQLPWISSFFFLNNNNTAIELQRPVCSQSSSIPSCGTCSDNNRRLNRKRGEECELVRGNNKQVVKRNLTGWCTPIYIRHAYDTSNGGSWIVYVRDRWEYHKKDPELVRLLKKKERWEDALCCANIRPPSQTQRQTCASDWEIYHDRWALLLPCRSRIMADLALRKLPG